MALSFGTIAPAEYIDIPTLAAISSNAFEGDSQTEMKRYGRVPFDMQEYSLKSLPDTLQNPKLRTLKAVDKVGGDIMGYCIWGFRGVAAPESPKLDTYETGASNTDNESKHAEEEQNESDDREDPIARLNKLTSKDFADWVNDLMAGGAACLFVVGLYVSTAFQRRGVGSALLKWGTDIADKHGAFAWVHSSAGAWRAYEKAGFRTVRTLTVDLDEYAPVPAPKKYPGGKWGEYTFRYMVYGAPTQVSAQSLG